MRKLLTIALLGLGLFMSSTLAQPVPTEKTFTLTIGRTVTDSVKIPGNYIPSSVRVLDVTNVTTITPTFGFARRPSVFWPVLEVGTSTDYSVSIADTSIAVFDANNIQSFLGNARDDSDAIWMQLKVNAAEAATVVFVVRFRYF